MRFTYFFTISVVVLLGVWSCTPERGCIEATADNFDALAEEDDGTCIPARDKLVGRFRYTRLWTDVVSGDNMMDFGGFQLTEANTANNSFNCNFNGQLFLQGSVSAYDLLFENHVIGTSSYYGSGKWLTSDSVDMVLNLTYQDLVLPIPQSYSYYCTKLP